MTPVTAGLVAGLAAAGAAWVPWAAADLLARADGNRRPAPRLHLPVLVRTAWQRLAGDPHHTDAIAAFLESVAEGRRAGWSLPQALCATRVDPRLADEVETLQAGVRHGLRIDDALRPWAEGDDDRRLAAAVLSLVADVGGPSARAIEDAARRLRRRADLRRQARAMAAQATASAAVVSLAPVAFLLVSLGSDQRTLEFLTGTAPGLACLVAGLVLDLFGFVWMRRLVWAAAP